MKQYKQKQREQERSKRDKGRKRTRGKAQDEAGVNVDFKDAKPEQQLQDLSDIFLFEKERERVKYFLEQSFVI